MPWVPSRVARASLGERSCDLQQLFSSTHRFDFSRLVCMHEHAFRTNCAMPFFEDAGTAADEAKEAEEATVAPLGAVGVGCNM